MRLGSPIQKHAGSTVAAPAGGGGEAPANFFFSQMDKMFYAFFFFQKWSYLHERCGMCWSDSKINFPIFSFWDIVVFLLKINNFSINFGYKIDHNSKTIKYDFWFASVLCASFLEIWPLLRGEAGGLQILSWEKFQCPAHCKVLNSWEWNFRASEFW